MHTPMHTPLPRSRQLLAWLGHTAGSLGLLVLLVLPSHKYAWMAAVDGSTDPAALEDASGNRLLWATFVMLLASGVQVLGLVKTGSMHGTRHRAVACLLMAAVVAVWAFKFWPG